MSEHKMHDALKRTVRHVVETMCFSEVALTEHSWENADTIVTAVNFYGSRTGRLQLAVSSSAAWSLRDAFLGKRDEETAPDESAGDLVNELGTMICGRFLSSVDPLAKMSIEAPQQGKTYGSALQDITQDFVLDAGHLTASVQFDKE